MGFVINPYTDFCFKLLFNICRYDVLNKNKKLAWDFLNIEYDCGLWVVHYVLNIVLGDSLPKMRILI